MENRFFNYSSLLLAINILFWVVLLVYQNNILIASILMIISIPLLFWSFKKNRNLGIVSLLINPFSFCIILSIMVGVGTTVTGDPELTFVTYDSKKTPFNQRDNEMKRRDIDPEMGVWDYMFSVPNNAIIRFLMSFEGKVDRPFKLIYRDELPNKLYLL